METQPKEKEKGKNTPGKEGSAVKAKSREGSRVGQTTEKKKEEVVQVEGKNQKGEKGGKGEKVNTLGDKKEEVKKDRPLSRKEKGKEELKGK